MTDEELIKSWHDTKNYTAYKLLKDRHRGMVLQMVNQYRAAAIPAASLEAEAWLLFDDAVNHFKPDQGAKFSTYLNYQLRKLDRHTKKYQNVARIPEVLAGKIGDYDRKQQELAQDLKRQPTNKEMAGALGMKVKHVEQLNRSRRGDFFEGKFEGQDVVNQNEKIDWILREVRDELNPQELQVYDHLIGYNVKKITNKRDLATKLNMSPGRVSQITRQIADKINPHIKSNL